MRIGYFGGSFDPPHRGHLTVACAARDRFLLDHVLLAPTGRQPLKPNGPEAPFADRLRMTELLCQGQQGLEASAIDAPRPDGAPNYTADTLRRLRAELTTRHLNQPLELYAILGADAFQHMSKWREPEALFQLAQWIIVSRPGYDLPSATHPDQTPAQRGRIHPLQGPADPTSATDLREHLAKGGDSSSTIPDAIRRYILKHHLYRHNK